MSNVKTMFNVGDVVNLTLDEGKRGKGVVWSANYSMTNDINQNFYWVKITEGVKYPDAYEIIPLHQWRLLEMQDE